MSFIFFSKKNPEKLFVFLHIPKNGGNSFIEWLRLNSIYVHRPKILIGHLSYSDTLSRVKYLAEQVYRVRYSLFQDTSLDLKKISFLACTREPLSRYRSMYSYLLKTSPYQTGHFFEHDLFSRISFDQYISILLSEKLFSFSHAWKNQNFYLDKNIQSHSDFTAPPLIFSSLSELVDTTSSLLNISSCVDLPKLNSSNSQDIVLNASLEHELNLFDSL